MAAPVRAALMITCLGDVFFPEVGVAMVRLLGDVGTDRARSALEAGDGVVRAALRHIDAHPDAPPDLPGTNTLTTP